MLHDRSPRILVTETRTHSPSYTCCGRRTWVRLTWVLRVQSLPVCREGGGRGSVSSDGLADDESASKLHACWQDSVSRRWPLTSGRPQLCGLFQHGGSFRARVQAKKVTTESLREGGRPDILKPSPLPYSVSQKHFSGPGRTGGDGHPRER